MFSPLLPFWLNSVAVCDVRVEVVEVVVVEMMMVRTSRVPRRGSGMEFTAASKGGLNFTHTCVCVLVCV